MSLYQISFDISGIPNNAVLIGSDFKTAAIKLKGILKLNTTEQ
jgi:hypothetical protein